VEPEGDRLSGCRESYQRRHTHRTPNGLGKPLKNSFLPYLHGGRMATGTPAMIVVPIERVNGVSTAPPPSAVIPVSAWRGYYGRPVGRVP